jgi:ferric-dicitrate binding protein FerR (iron transport regulator)
MADRQLPDDVNHEVALGRLAELARAHLPPADLHLELRKQRAYERVREAVAPGRRRRAAWRLAGALAAGLVVLGAVRTLHDPALTFTVEGGAVAEGGYVAAPANAEPALRFSDGTVVKLGRASRGRVASTTRRGARVLLDEGHAAVSVRPRPGNDWTFDAGPCVVHVTGTQFDMRWSAGDQVLEVRLYHGQVVVDGPPAPRGGIVMREGQRLTVDVRQGSARLALLTPEPAPVRPPEPAVVVEPVAEPEPVAERGPGERPPGDDPRARGERRGDSWSTRLLAGDFAGVLGEAQRRGVEGVLRHDGPADVMALAEAARYSRERSLARRALLAVRARFPRSAQAQKAAFLLGRMAEDEDGELGRALEWYGRYLAGAPDGPYRDEALGRQMTATLRLRGAALARPLAARYLLLYPSGAYAKPARAIEQPSE